MISFFLSFTEMINNNLITHVIYTLYLSNFAVLLTDES